MTDEDAGDVGEETSSGAAERPRTQPHETTAEVSDSVRRLRARRLLDRYFLVAALLVVFVVLTGSVLVYTVHIDPGTELEEQTEMEWQETGQFSHEATVVNESEAFELGETLHGRSTYFTQSSPTLDGVYEYEYVASEGEIDATVGVTLLIRAVSDGEILWERTEELDNQTFDGIRPGERVTASFELDVPEIEQRVQDTESSLGSSIGQTEILVEGSVVSSGTVEQRSVDADHTNTLILTPSGSTYSVTTDGAYAQSHQQTANRQIERSHGLLSQIAGPFVLLTGVLFGGILGGLRYRGVIALSVAEQRVLTHRQKRAELDDWITIGVEQSVITRDTWIETDSLEGLVDIAIDTNNRVIEDPTGPIYYVVGDVVYTYTPNLDVNTEASIEESPETRRENGDPSGPVSVHSLHERHLDSRGEPQKGAKNN